MERIAFLPFENLTGDASLDWIRTAVPQVVAQELAGVKDTVTFAAADLRDAHIRSATRLVHGYVDRRARTGQGVHVEIAIEDSASRRMLQTSSFDGEVLAISERLAKSIHSAAKPFSTSNPQALEAWGAGEIDRALALDPGFGAAWLTKIQRLTLARDIAGARAAAEQALRSPSLRSPLDRAQIELAAAALRNDPNARANALLSLTDLLPNDTQLLRSLADSEILARRFPEAIRLFEQLAKLPSPAVDVFNQLGYAYGLAGDVAGARKAFEQYSRQPGQQPNSLDSLGEVLFLNGQFAEAEKKFLEAHERAPAMLSGGDLSKAAYARWLQGDLKGADETHDRYIEFRIKAGDALSVWRQSTWLWATGRKDQAIEKLQSAGNGNPQIADIAPKQLLVWRSSKVALPQGLDALKKLYEATQPLEDGLIRTLYAEALLEAGNRDEAKRLTAQWPLPDTKADAVLQSLLYPKFSELKSRIR